MMPKPKPPEYDPEISGFIGEPTTSGIQQKHKNAFLWTIAIYLTIITIVMYVVLIFVFLIL